MNKKSLSFLESLLKTPSPTGFETKIQKVVKRYMSQYADEIKSDLHGNLIVGINTNAKKKVMLAGHCDQIGFMVKHIDKNGFIYVDQLGGIDPGVLYGTKVSIWGKKGEVLGVFGRKAIHLQTAEERTKAKYNLNKMWIDIGAKNEKEALKLVSIGDAVTFKLEVSYLNNNLICAPGIDDKVGLFVCMEALRLSVRSKLNVALYAVSTVQEEVGLRGARTATYSIDPEVGIAVDVTHASDSPENNNQNASPCKLGYGPGIYTGPNINPIALERLKQTAKKLRIPSQILPSSRLLGNDANAMQVTRGGVAAASIGIPNRYMHTQAEIVSLKDLENAAKLLAGFVKDIKPNTSFIPK